MWSENSGENTHVSHVKFVYLYILSSGSNKIFIGVQIIPFANRQGQMSKKYNRIIFEIIIAYYN
jgi:hypothetical protein